MGDKKKKDKHRATSQSQANPEEKPKEQDALKRFEKLVAGELMQSCQGLQVMLADKNAAALVKMQEQKESLIDLLTKELTASEESMTTAAALMGEFAEVCRTEKSRLDEQNESFVDETQKLGQLYEQQSKMVKGKRKIKK